MDGLSIKPSRWVGRIQRTTNATIRLFCLPYAGSNASQFNNWPNLLPPTIDVFPIELPGRRRHLNEEPIDTMPRLVEALSKEMTPYLDLPFAVCGYCFGATVAFEWVRRQRRSAGPMPISLIPICQHAPQIQKPFTPVHLLPTDKLCEHLAEMGGTPPEVLNNPDLLKLILPAVTADFKAIETYEYADEPPLDVPILAVGGSHDRFVDPVEVEGWISQTSSFFTPEILTDQHNLPQTEELLLAAISRQLEAPSLRANASA
jgi:surfactin synthase thioesterase subunit